MDVFLYTSALSLSPPSSRPASSRFHCGLIRCIYFTAWLPVCANGAKFLTPEARGSASVSLKQYSWGQRAVVQIYETKISSEEQFLRAMLSSCSCEACPISSAQMLLNLTSKNARPHLKSNCHLQDLYEIPCPKYFSPVLITDHWVSWWDDALASDWLQNSPKQDRNSWVLMPLSIKILRECMFFKLLILHK